MQDNAFLPGPAFQSRWVTHLYGHNVVQTPSWISGPQVHTMAEFNCPFLPAAMPVGSQIQLSLVNKMLLKPRYSMKHGTVLLTEAVLPAGSQGQHQC